MSIGSLLFMIGSLGLCFGGFIYFICKSIKD